MRKIYKNLGRFTSKEEQKYVVNNKKAAQNPEMTSIQINLDMSNSFFFYS